MGLGENIINAHIDYWTWLLNKQPKKQQFVPSTGSQRLPGPPSPSQGAPSPSGLKIDDDDLASARKQIRKIARSLVTKMASQRKRTKKHKQLDFRKTMREAISTGGIPVNLKWKAKPTKKTRLLVVLDTSGSMTSYDVMLLQIIQSIKLELSNFELFIFADNLEYVTNDVKRDTNETIANLKKKRSWYGGTDIFRSLTELQDNYSKLLNPNTIVLMLTDMDSDFMSYAALVAKDIRKKVKRFYIFNVEGSPDPAQATVGEMNNYRFYHKRCVQPFEEVVDKIFTTKTLEDMSEAVQNICLK